MRFYLPLALVVWTGTHVLHLGTAPPAGPWISPGGRVCLQQQIVSHVSLTPSGA